MDADAEHPWKPSPEIPRYPIKANVYMSASKEPAAPTKTKTSVFFQSIQTQISLVRKVCLVLRVDDQYSKGM